MRNYYKGRRLEYRVKEKLEKAGYFVVRAAASKGIADLVAVKIQDFLDNIPEDFNELLSLGYNVLLVQVKSRKPTKKELRSYPKSVVVVYKDRRKLKCKQGGS